MENQYRDLFGPGSNPGARVVEDYSRLKEIVDSLRVVNPETRVVLVLGTYDLLHIGHARHLERCKELGDVVIVAVDPDEMVRMRKGKNRPVVPQEERIEMLTHLRHVDLVTLVHDYDAKGLWTYGLLKDWIKPDLLVLSIRPPVDQVYIGKMQALAKEVIVFESQAETSTSAKIRLLLVDFADTVKRAIEQLNISNLVVKAIDDMMEQSPDTKNEAPKEETKPAKREW